MHIMWRSAIVTSVHALYIEKSVMSTCRVEGFPIQVGFEWAPTFVWCFAFPDVSWEPIPQCGSCITE